MLKIIEKPDLPKDLFGQDVKPELLSQAVRVYNANQRQGTQSALTRAEVNRTRKKVFKQKGTGHARHGDRKAPIFVGGGIAFAPKPRDYSLSLSSKMRVKARVGALSKRASDKSIIVASGLAGLEKTKELAKFLKSSDAKAKSWLVVTDKPNEMIFRSARNIDGVEVSPMNMLNVYQILRADKILIMSEAIAVETETPVRKTKKTVRKAAK